MSQSTEATHHTHPEKMRSRAAIDLLLIAVFCAALVLPMTDNAFDLDPTPERQPQDPLPWSALLEPSSSLSSWFARAKSVTNLRLGFRDTLIRWHGTVGVQWLGVSTTPRVELGRDGWFFMGEQTMEGHRRIRPFSDFTVRSAAARLERQREWLANHGIHYLVVPVPSKQSIYPERVAEHHATRAHLPSRLDQLIAAVHEDTRVDLIDLRPALSSARAQGSEVYHRYDLHWNARGAYVGYREIFERLAKRWGRLTPRPPDAFEPGSVAREGDLARMLGLREVFVDHAPLLRPRFESSAVIAGSGQSVRTYRPRFMVPFSTRTSHGQRLRAMIFRDSFGDELVPFAAEHFAHARFVWHDSLDILTRGRDSIEALRPNLVIHLFGEHVLSRVGLATP